MSKIEWCNLDAWLEGEKVVNKAPTALLVQNPREIIVLGLFDEGVLDEEIDKALAIMGLGPAFRFCILTENSKRMREHMNRHEGLVTVPVAFNRIVEVEWPLPNVWLGVTAENQDQADKRVPDLLATPAVGRFVSYEPALGPVDWGRIPWRESNPPPGPPDPPMWINTLSGGKYAGNGAAIVMVASLPHLNGIIMGGESGPRARPMNSEWARATRDQCDEAGVAVFFKGWGGKGKKAAGRELDGRKHDDLPWRASQPTDYITQYYEGRRRCHIKK